MKELAREQVIKAAADKVPNAPGYCLTHLFMSPVVSQWQLNVLVGCRKARSPS